MPGKRPNILLITSDQQHWNTLGVLNPEVKTPRLDTLAAQGTLFERAYTVNPTCTPTRASIITGKYPSQHGAWSLGTKLPESEHTVGEDFQAADYRTALVGKAHFQPLVSTPEYSSLESYPIMQDLDFWRDFHGPFYGFEHVELARNHTNEAHVGQHYALWMEEKGCLNWRDYFLPPTGNRTSMDRAWNIPEELHYDAWIAERTNNLLSGYASKGENFFLWASFFDPHPHYMAPEPWDRMYDPATITIPHRQPGEHDRNSPHLRMTQERRPDFSSYKEPGGSACHGFQSHLHEQGELAKDIATYYGMISLMDKYIGNILDRLEALGLADDTLVVFTTDHGHFYGHHGLIAKGAFHYEDAVRVPFIVRRPGRVPAGARSQALVSLVDLAPTFLGTAKLPIPRAMTGRDQTPVWTGALPSIRDHVLIENHHQPTTIHQKTYVNERYKLTVYLNQDYGELFDLLKDPGEFNNLWDSHSHGELRASLMQRFLFAEMGKEPMWMPRIAGA